MIVVEWSIAVLSVETDYMWSSTILVNILVHMSSFPHPTHWFAAAGENVDFVFAVNNFMLNLCDF